MEATKTAHFTGETVVWRGPWHMEIPLDFHIFLNPEISGAEMKTAAMVMSQFLSQEWVENAEAEASMMEEEEYEED